MPSMKSNSPRSLLIAVDRVGKIATIIVFKAQVVAN